jgi:hypothetical protein
MGKAGGTFIGVLPVEKTEMNSGRVARPGLRPAATEAMKRIRWPGLVLAGAGLVLTALSGCQTWVAGMTLPSGRYLQHPPQYFPPSPPFPLERELASMDRVAAEAALAEAGGGAAVPLPNGVPPRPPIEEVQPLPEPGR